MGIVNGYIHATDALSVSEVAVMLDVSSQDVGSVCTSSSINKWARYKPVNYRSVSRLTNEQLKSVQFGLTPKEHVKLETFNYIGDAGSGFTVDDILGYNEEWEYKRPSGGAASPYRLSDFMRAEGDSVNWGYYPLTPPPISDYSGWTISLTTIRNVANSTNLTSGSSAYNSVYNKGELGDATYHQFKMMWSEDGTSWGNIGGQDSHAIPITALLFGNMNTPTNQYWRLALAVHIPIQNSNGFIGYFVSRSTFANLKVTNSNDNQYILPSISTNPYMCQLISDYMDYRYNNHLSSATNPKITLRAVFCLVKDMGAEYLGGKLSQKRVSNVTKIYTAPSTSLEIPITIIDNFHYQNVDLYQLVTIESVGTGNWAWPNGASWEKKEIRNLVVKQTASSVAGKVVNYYVKYTVVTSSSGDYETRERSGSITLQNGNESVWVSSVIDAGPAIQIVEYRLT